MALQKMPVFVNIYPDGHGTLTCAHCAVDAELEGAQPTALYTTQDGTRTLLEWQSPLTPERLLAAAASQCQHLAAYRDA